MSHKKVSGARTERRPTNAEIVLQRRGPAPTGEVLDRGGSFAVCLGRSFRAAPEVVWEWLTSADRRRVWLGESDAEQQMFRLAGGTMDAPQLAYEIERVERPERLTLSLRDATAAVEGGSSPTPAPRAAWRVDLTLTRTNAGCHLMLEQAITDRVAAPSVAAACEFYLDRLVRACHGEPFTDLDSDDYFLSQGPAYRRMFPLPRTEQRA